MKFLWVLLSSIGVVGYCVFQFFAPTWEGVCEFRFQNAICTTMRPGTQATPKTIDNRAVIAIEGTVFQHIRTPRAFTCLEAKIIYQSAHDVEFGFQFGEKLTDVQYEKLPQTENWTSKTFTIAGENARYNAKEQRYQISYRAPQGNLWVDSFEISGKSDCSR